MNDNKITTGRLVLRPPTYEDLEALFEIHGDPETNKFNPSGPQRNIEESRVMLNRWLKHWETYGFGYWVVATKKHPQKIIGCGGLFFKDFSGTQRANLYFRFRPSAWGRGYATEMANKAKKYAYEDLNLSHIAATVRPTNKPSIKLLERLGMIRRGIIKNEKGESYFYILEFLKGQEHSV
ncbi:MAG: GNAT family N-acetyltransferase [Balneolaceae bacterium]|jgi:RimJ/RimL family protein N-acetyltransferase